MPLIQEDRPAIRPTIVAAICAKCAVSLKPSFGEEHADGVFEGALYVTLSGPSYGEFMDGERAVTEVLCVDCAKQLVADNPWLAKAMEANRDDMDFGGE